MDLRPSNVNWSIVAPVVLVVAALLAVAWLEFGYATDSEPAPFLGTIGTPVRGTYVPPTALPTQVQPTPGPRPPAEGVTGTPAERDAQRRSDMLVLVAALEEYAEEHDEYPPTGGNVQTLCAFLDVDAGCQLEDVVGRAVPVDPLGAPHDNGYWYQSDGSTATLYASFEEELDAGAPCDDPHPGLAGKPNLICLRLP